MKRKLLALPALAAAFALALTGCTTTGATHSSSDSASGTISIVASTNVYGDIARQIGGARVNVTSIIDDPDKDPHEYQADARNQLAISTARIVIENGGGYDDFVGTMLNAARPKNVTVLNAVDISGFAQSPADGAFNEHVWYDFPTVAKVVERLVAALSKAAPQFAAAFAANGTAFSAKLATLEASEASLKAQYAGRGAAITEPVPLYMLTAIGLDDKTPEKFSEAIEAGTDVAPDVLRSTLALFSDHAVDVLAYNEQTSGPQTDAVLAAAKANDIAAVPVTETLPAGKHYIGWMTDTLHAIGAALKASSGQPSSK